MGRHFAIVLAVVSGGIALVNARLSAQDDESAKNQATFAKVQSTPDTADDMGFASLLTT